MPLPPITGEDPAGERPNLRLIARHEQRRLAGLPTVSVLLADVPVARAHWRRWIRSARPAAELTFADPRELTIAIVDVLRGAMELSVIALYFLTRSAGLGAQERPLSPTSRTPHDLERLAQAALDAGAPPGPARAALEICRSAQTNPRSAQIVERIEAALAGSAGLPWWRVLEAVAFLLPDDLLPAILLSPPIAADARAWLCESAGSTAQLAQSVPKWSVSVAMPPDAFNRYAREAPASRSKSLLENGIIPLGIDEAPLCPAEVMTCDAPVAIGGMKAIEPSPRLAESLETAKTLQPRQDELARSAAERLLFELLESHPDSKGQFVLNGNPGFVFGSRAAEVDLLAPGLRLAVEVDGYFHFTDPTSYRRDRRKDWELQRRGHLIVRVLAEDVVTRMGEVLDFILAAIDHCRHHPIGEDVEP
jgi:hypothetical protein